MPNNRTLPGPLLKWIDFTANRVLRTDPATLQQLVQFHGHRLQVHVSDPGLSLELRITTDGVAVTPVCEEPADLVLEGPAFVFLRLAARPGDRSLLFGGQIRVSGDTELAGNIADCLADLEIDKEALIAPVLGDVAAHGIGQMLDQAGSWFRRSAQHLWLDLGEYLENESGLPSRSEAQRLFSDIDDTRDAVDRLAARIERLQSTASSIQEKG